MPAPKGNQYYKIRSTDGRDTAYTPDSLIEKANEYFQWCLENPLLEEVSYHSNGIITKTQNAKLRVFSIQGFCNYAEITHKTFFNYEERKDFLQVTTRIRGIIENQQFEGATANLLNANIIARKLGLMERIDHTSKEEKITMSKDEISNELNRILNDVE